MAPSRLPCSRWPCTTFVDQDIIFRELARVLADDGRFVLFTGAREQMRRYWLNVYFPDAMEQAISQMPSMERTVVSLLGAGFTRVTAAPFTVTAELQDLFLYAGKERPELYFDPRVRQGISTFADLADPAELERGCARLADDLASGRFAEIHRAARHGGGDYVFLVAERG